MSYSGFAGGKKTQESPPGDSGFSIEEYKERIAKAIVTNSERKINPYKRIKKSRPIALVDGKLTYTDTPTKKSNFNAKAKKWLEENGYKFERVDYFDARTQRSHDLLGIFDFLAFKNGETVGVQITSVEGISARKTKILASYGYQYAKLGGWKIVILGFDQSKEARELWL